MDISLYSDIGYFASRNDSRYIWQKTIRIIFTVLWTGIWILTILVPNVTFLYIARFIPGVIVEMFCAVLPAYVTEIAEISI